MTQEFNFDGLVGPTHNYAGLSYGNVASMEHANMTSSPKQAAKQGLDKMRVLMNLGIPQAVLPPHQRPNIELLRTLGFNSIEQAHKYNPEVVAALFSAASMWTANAATISPSVNTRDGKLHITPANLTYNLHRAQEAQFNYKLFKKIFFDQEFFTVHQPLPGYADLSDEGAANHNNFCTAYDKSGLEMYVYGRTQGMHRFPGRQTRLASKAMSLTHDLKNEPLIVQQNPDVIDAGVFHNDVICVVNQNVIFYHQDAFIDWSDIKKKIDKFFSGNCHFVEISTAHLSIEQAVKSYIFNSQLVDLADGSMALIMPAECEAPEITGVLDEVMSGNNPINTLKFVECRESMRNGGGPACLRLRVVLNDSEQHACHQAIIMTDNLLDRLNGWVEKHYRDRLAPKDLLDPKLIVEVNTALDDLTKILDLGSIYPFQCE